MQQLYMRYLLFAGVSLLLLMVWLLNSWAFGLSTTFQTHDDTFIRRHPDSDYYAELRNTELVCSSGTSVRTQGLPVYLFVAGLEGAGHHMIEQFMQHVANEYPLMDLQFIGYDPQLHVGHGHHSGETELCAMKERFERRLLGAGPDTLVIDSLNSYPFGMNRDEDAYPRLQNLAQFDGILYHLQVLFVYRNPVDGIYSVQRRFNGSLETTEQLVHQMTHELHDQLRTVPCGKLLVLSYERMVEKPHLVLGALYGFIKGDMVYNFLPSVSGFVSSFRKVVHKNRHVKKYIAQASYAELAAKVEPYKWDWMPVPDTDKARLQVVLATTGYLFGKSYSAYRYEIRKDLNHDNITIEDCPEPILPDRYVIPIMTVEGATNQLLDLISFTRVASQLDRVLVMTPFNLNLYHELGVTAVAQLPMDRLVDTQKMKAGIHGMVPWEEALNKFGLNDLNSPVYNKKNSALVRLALENDYDERMELHGVLEEERWQQEQEAFGLVTRTGASLKLGELFDTVFWEDDLEVLELGISSKQYIFVVAGPLGNFGRTALDATEQFHPAFQNHLEQDKFRHFVAAAPNLVEVASSYLGPIAPDFITVHWRFNEYFCHGSQFFETTNAQEGAHSAGIRDAATQHAPKLTHINRDSGSVCFVINNTHTIWHDPMVIVNYLIREMGEHDVKKIYVASDNLRPEFWDFIRFHFKEALIEPIWSAAARNVELPKTNAERSEIEKQIALRGRHFIGLKSSTWAIVVHDLRHSMHRVSKLGDGIPDASLLVTMPKHVSVTRPVIVELRGERNDQQKYMLGALKSYGNGLIRYVTTEEAGVERLAVDLFLVFTFYHTKHGSQFVKKHHDDAVTHRTIPVLIGDELCQLTSINDTIFGAYPATFRTYESIDIMHDPTVHYFPLGTRHTFSFDGIEQLPDALSRKYAFNAMFALSTSGTRVILSDVLDSFLKVFPIEKSFVKLTQSWDNEFKDYVPAERYREILGDSTFTLCPQGHNPETYRLYEALEMGSIPVLVRAKFSTFVHSVAQLETYKSGITPCKGHDMPWTGAPFVWLDSWEELPAVLLALLNDDEAVVAMQQANRDWYAAFKHRNVAHIENVLLGVSAQNGF